MTARENPCTGRYAGCSADPPDDRRMCASCAATHAAKAAARRAELRARKACVVCGKSAAKAHGETLTTCKAHREYYRQRDAEARASKAV